MSGYYTITAPNEAVSSAVMLRTATNYAAVNGLRLATVTNSDTLRLYSRDGQLTQTQIANAPMMCGWEMRIYTCDIMTMKGIKAMTAIEYNNAAEPF
jgi:predicted type IV restriction endonuclease